MSRRLNPPDMRTRVAISLARLLPSGKLPPAISSIFSQTRLVRWSTTASGVATTTSTRYGLSVSGNSVESGNCHIFRSDFHFAPSDLADSRSADFANGMLRNIGLAFLLRIDLFVSQLHPSLSYLSATSIHAQKKIPDFSGIIFLVFQLSRLADNCQSLASGKGGVVLNAFSATYLPALKPPHAPPPAIPPNASIFLIISFTFASISIAIANDFVSIFAAAFTSATAQY